MNTDRVHLFLTAGLAVGLGFFASHALSLRDARAYPAGHAVSYGANPLFALGGSGSATLFTAPTDQIMVVTDVVLSAEGDDGGLACESTISLTTSGGDTLGVYTLASDTTSGSGYTEITPTVIQHAYSSGLPIPSGESLALTDSGTCTVTYSFSGYYSQP